MKPEVYRYMLIAKVYSYLEKHEEAVRVLTDGLNVHPRSPHLYRHRGEFKIALRDFDGTVRDLKEAVVLMEGLPDEIDYYQAQLLPEIEKVMLGGESELLATPTPVDATNLSALADVYKGTLLSSSWYHLALGHFLQGEYEEAVTAFRRTIEVGADDDLKVAASDWLYLGLGRLGRVDEAQAVLKEASREDLHTNSPLYVRRLAIYAGLSDPRTAVGPSDDARAQATVGYGLGSWHLLNGRTDEATGAFTAVLGTRDRSAFGYVAAETDLGRLAKA